MVLPTQPQLAKHWNQEDTNLEDLLFVRDFFDTEDDSTRNGRPPLIALQDGGLMASYAVDGLDPEPLGNGDLLGASRAIGRAFDLFNPGNLEPLWGGGTWEIQTVFMRRQCRPPLLSGPARKSAALEYLAKACNDYFQHRLVFKDELVWYFRYVPFFKLQTPALRRAWRQLDVNAHAELIREKLQAQASMVRRTLQAVEESVGAFSTSRPRMQFGLRQTEEQETFDAIWRQVNRRGEGSPTLRKDLPLHVQLAVSERVEGPSDYRINGRPTKVLTWKVPPSGAIGYMFARLQNELRFPFTVSQCFRAIPVAAVEGQTRRRGRLARTLARRLSSSAAYALEADEFLRDVAAGRCPFDWQFTLIVDGETTMEAEDRAARVTSQLRHVQAEELGIQAGEPIEERANRVFGELATLPGNGLLNLRENRITSRAAGDLVMGYKLSGGDEPPFMLLGDRKGGVFGYSPFTRREPNFNKVVAGGPGTGKSTFVNALGLSVAMFPSQIYVFDKGNSYGPIFEVLREDDPREVAVMRFGDGDFQFNPYPLCEALLERERQKADGTYRMRLPDGGTLPDPVEEDQRVFEAWLPSLLGNGSELDRREREYLDRALKGRNGEGGFYLEYEAICRSYLRAVAAGRPAELPRPLSSLLAHLQNQKVVPQLAEALEYWTRKPRDQFFDSGKDSVAAARFVYFELSGLLKVPTLVVPFVAALMGTIWRRIQNPRCIQEYKAVLIDEFWAFLAQTAFFGMAEEMFREIRKYRGLIAAASQSPNDFKEGRTRALMQCASEKWLFKGFREDEFMRKDLELQEHHLEMHRGLRADGQGREVLYVGESGLTRALSIDIPPALYWFATTDGEDKYWRGVFSRHFGGLVPAVEHLMKACGEGGHTVPVKRVKLIEAYARANGMRTDERAA
jgi:hypothetical protein